MLNELYVPFSEPSLIDFSTKDGIDNLEAYLALTNWVVQQSRSPHLMPITKVEYLEVLRVMSNSLK